MSKYIGDVSAYAYAVSKGYTGTEEEFAELMADYADVGQRAEDAAESALNSKTAAQTAAQTATSKASEASTSATSASGSASAASASASAASGSATNAAASATSASGSATAAAGSATTASTKASEAAASATAAQAAQTAAEAAQTAAETAQGKAEDAQEAAEDAAESVSASAAQIATNTADIAELQSEVSQKANIDGAYSDLTAGNAEQLVSTVYEEDSVPYIFRTAGGSMDIGDREEDMLVGGTVAWNQLANPVTSDYWSAESNVSVAFADSVATFTSQTTNNGIKSNSQKQVAASHVYYMGFSFQSESASTITCLYGGNGGVRVSFTSATSMTDVYKIAKADASASGENIYFFPTASGVNVEHKVKNAMIIDLTAMFGSTIADYIYNLETATPGAGVAWFRKLFPADYYPYDAGTLKSVEGVSAHAMTGFNQWDEEWEAYGVSQIRSKNRIPVLPGVTYYAKTPSVGVSLYFKAQINDANNVGSASVTNNTFTVPTNAHYVVMYTNTGYGTVYNHDICINLSWDGERDGEYEAYKEYVYQLDSDLELRGIPKLDSANNLYYDGDTYESDGTVTRRYGIVDLGTLNWGLNNHATLGDYFYTDVTSLGIKRAGEYTSTIFPSVCSKYNVTRRVASVFVDKTYCFDGSVLDVTQIQIKDSAYSDAAAFKTAMSGVYLVYEIATPTTESAEPYQNPQIVDDFGTEEYVTTSIVPVGHVTKYQPNLRAKLEMSPDNPDGDGDYIVRQANGENSYVSLASTATIQNILARLTALEGNTNEG